MPMNDIYLGVSMHVSYDSTPATLPSDAAVQSAGAGSRHVTSGSNTHLTSSSSSSSSSPSSSPSSSSPSLVLSEGPLSTSPSATTKTAAHSSRSSSTPSTSSTLPISLPPNPS